MFEFARRIFTFTIAAALVAYFVFVLVGATMYSRAEDRGRIVWARDDISQNTHRVTGFVPIDSSCTELTQTTERLSPVLFKLKFTTWENPNIECTEELIKKPFSEIVFAPAVGVHFIATMNDLPIPIMMVPYIPQ